MKKRLLSLAMALCMVLSLLPATAFADENAETPVCTCEEACTLEEMDAECPVCGAEGATVENCCKYAVPATEAQPEATTPTEAPVCTCEEACTAEAMNAECPVCSAEGASVEDCCKYVAPEQDGSTETTTPPEVPVCSCEDACTADAMDAECPVCGAEGAVLENCGNYIAPSVEEQVEEVVQMGAPAGEEPELTAVEKVQAMINALPTVEDLEDTDDETVDEVYAALQDVYDALDELSTEELDQITGLDKLAALMEWFNGQVAALDDGTVTTEEELINAVAAAKSGDTITLGANITLTKDLVVNYQTVDTINLTLDMNNYTLNGTIKLYACIFTVIGKLDADVYANANSNNGWVISQLYGGTYAGNVVGYGVNIFSGTFEKEISGSSIYILGGTFQDTVVCERVYGGTFLKSCTVKETLFEGIFYGESIINRVASKAYAVEYLNFDKTTIAIEYRTEGDTFSGVTPSRKGYIFNKGIWYIIDADGKLTGNSCTLPGAIPADKFTNRKIIAFPAMWEAKYYTVKFNTNGGDNNISDKTHVKWTDDVLKFVNAPTKTGYTFNGWKCDETGGTVTETTTYGDIDVDDKLGSITLTAQWAEKDGYSVTLDTNGGNAIESKTGVKWTDKVLDGITDPVKDGWEFTGWKYGDTIVKADTTYDKLASSDTVESIELTAQWKDIAGPTGEICIGINKWEALPDNITFGLFFKDTQTVKITASDNSGEAVTIGYLITDKALSDGELAAATFDTYDSEFTIAPDRACVVYAKLADTSGNVEYISSNGIVLDATAPVISGIEDGKTYCSSQTFTVTETYLDKVTVNGVEVALDGSNQYTLDPAEGTRTIAATDKAGNKAEITVTVNERHTYGEWQSNGNSTHTRYCIVEGCSVHEDGNCSGGKATCTSKGVCEYCGKEYGEIDSTNHNLEKVPAKAATVTETGNIEYWQCQDCGDIFSDPDGKDEIELEDTVTEKLPPKIIKGKGQSVTEGEKNALSFTSNAAFSDFIRVELDGKTLDDKNYSAKEGSTVVTLDADYVSTLPAGEHTIGIVSESGTASTTFTVNEKADSTDSPQAGTNNTNTPQTGDNSPLALWIALLFVSGGLLTVIGIYGKKKKYNR